MREILSEKLIRLAESCPYPLYVVGGKVRDYIAGLKGGTDTDICAPADVKDLVNRAYAAGYAAEAVFKNTGTVKLKSAGEELEFASFRSDKYVRGEHCPATTCFTDDINLDAVRRDFKCNAVYYDICAGQFVDPLGGIADIKAKRLTTVAPPLKVFSEDGLRLMRLARIAAQTGFTPADECIRGALANCDLIEDVHPQRIYAELDMILHADEKNGVPLAHYTGLNILKQTGVLQKILPELAACEGVKQRADFHNYDVLEHSFRAAAYADGGIRLSALLHDIGKPLCAAGTGSFIGHEKKGAELAEEICLRLGVPKKLTAETVRLISLHMYDLRGDARESKIRRFILSNYDIIDKILALKQADFSACKDDTSVAPSVIKIGGIYEKMRKEGVPFTLKELKIKGNDLISCGFAPEKVGAALESLLYDCALGWVLNDRDRLAARAVKVYL